MEKGEIILYNIRDLVPKYCIYLGGIAMTSMSPHDQWRESYGESLHEVGTDIKRKVQEAPDMEVLYQTPDQVLERFLKGMFGEAVSNRYKFEKGKYDAKNP